MKHFNPFNPGDPISAAKLNQLAAYAGVPQSALPTTPGTYFNSERTNAETETQQVSTILVFAMEDFEFQETDHATPDDCPSGLCSFVDLIRSTNTHVPQIDARPFYVHDPASMSGVDFDSEAELSAIGWSVSKRQYEVFHAVWNKQSKRWEALAGGIPRLQVILTGHLFAAVDTLTDPSTAMARILRRQANRDLALSSESIEVVNRFRNISIDAGIYTKVEWVDGVEWQPYAADCPSDSSSES